jgi:undecaprenyl-diphosphatase
MRLKGVRDNSLPAIGQRGNTSRGDKVAPLTMKKCSGIAWICLLLFALTAWARTRGMFAAIDHQVYLWAAQAASWEAWLTFWRAITAFGGTPAVLLTGVPLAIAGLVRDRSPRWLVLTLLITAAFFLPQFLKEIFAVGRPVSLIPAGPSPSLSFPSGHAFTAILIFFLFPRLLFLLLARRAPGPRLPAWPLRSPVWLSAVVLVMASRVFLGMHWVSDVVAGALLGGGCAGLFWTMAQRTSTQPAGGQRPIA